MDSRRALTVIATVAAALAAGLPSAAHAAKPSGHVEVSELATFAAPACNADAFEGCGQGSTVGPDRALYVTDGPGGRVLRIDPRTGAVSTFASGLPRKHPVPPIGAATDVVFAGRTAYVLVSLVGPAFGQPDVVGGLYRVRRDGTATPVVDLGAFSIAHPPATPFFVPSGVQYAVERYRDGFVVTDGHHNRVLRVTDRGRISVMRAFGNIVPTGLEVRGNHRLHGPRGCDPAPRIGGADPPHRAVVGRDRGRRPARRSPSTSSSGTAAGCTRCRRATGPGRRSRTTRASPRPRTPARCWRSATAAA